MITDFLTSAIATLSHIADIHEHALDVRFGPPCTEAEISEVERYIRSSLPPSLKRLLKWHNGIRLCFDDKRATGELLFPYGALELYGTAEIIDNTAALREWLDDIELSVYDARTRRNAYSCIDVASVSPFSSNLRVALSTTDILPDGEFPVIEVDLEVGVWLSAIAKDDLPSITIGESVDTFLERSINNVLAGRQTFRYWNTRAAWVKYS